ncbi:hypothetical protein V502_08834 [Pseudogymnoascus sp. VKM F-4520 (FW-2644)]|nr:hypothetical protein V502_08834 [Pseudogymnoascus sp. VKM F-4520 (FW-2644)]
MHFLQFSEYFQASTPIAWCSIYLEEFLMQALRKGPVPQHLAFVMDGNRRFAKNHNISIAKGHQLGFDVVQKILELCFMCDIRVVTMYFFSIENFKRPKSEVDSIMELFEYSFRHISKHGGLLHRYGATLRISGRLDLLEPNLQSTIQEITDLTRDYGEKVVNICLSYTSRDEIASAIRQTVADCKMPVQTDNYGDRFRSDLVRDSSTIRPFYLSPDASLCDHLDEKSVDIEQFMAISPQNITTETLADRMLTAGDPPPDILIRTSGAYRLSDFLLWQCHQGTQILFRTTLWPDFRHWQFFSTIREWQQQQRKQKLMTKNNTKRLLGQRFHATLDWIPTIVNSNRRTIKSMQKDIKGLRRLPEHLSVILPLGKEYDALERLMDQVAEMVAWSACAGISTLSVYEKNGTLKSYVPMLYQIAIRKLTLYYGSSSEKPVVHVFVPRNGIYCLSPAQPAVNPGSTGITLLLLSESDGRETLVDLTKSLAEMAQSGKLLLDDINIELIDAQLNEIVSQSSHSMPAIHETSNSIGHSNDPDANLPKSSTGLCPLKLEPDLLFIFAPYVNLDGYPPWQIRLTEIFYMGGESSSITGRDKVVKYRTFLRGLYQYAGAEMSDAARLIPESAPICVLAAVQYYLSVSGIKVNAIDRPMRQTD